MELTPLSGADQDALKELLFQLKRWTYPSINNAKAGTENGDYLISYKPPLQWRVRHITRTSSGGFASGEAAGTLAQNKNFGTFGTCIITNVDVNYSGAGIYSAAVSSGEAAPSFVGLTINFAEVKLLNREYFEKIEGS